MLSVYIYISLSKNYCCIKKSECYDFIGSSGLHVEQLFKLHHVGMWYKFVDIMGFWDSNDV